MCICVSPYESVYESTNVRARAYTDIRRTFIVSRGKRTQPLSALPIPAALSFPRDLSFRKIIRVYVCVYERTYVRFYVSACGRRGLDALLFPADSLFRGGGGASGRFHRN